MPIDPITGVWYPLLSPKQLEVFNCRQRYILSTGPRICGKSRGSLHRIVRHAWETDPCRFQIFTKLKSTALSGIWPLLTKVIIKEWLDAGIEGEEGEFKFLRTPRELGAIRMQYCTLRNMYGGESELQLFSLDFDDDVEDKVLSTEVSGYYFSELQTFSKPKIFSTTVQQLRMPGVKFEDHLWISDTNPPATSTDHFAYKIWFQDRTAPMPPDLSPEEQGEWKLYQDNLALFQYSLDDAVFADPKMIAQLKSNFRNDPEGWDRYVLGKWTKTRGHGDKHFSALFRPKVHVLGSINDPDRSQWELLNPDPTTTALFAGWDLGKVNHAMVIAQKKLTEDSKTRWEVLDELVTLSDKVRIEDFTRTVLDKRADLEKLIGHSVEWTDWTDTSAFDFTKGGTDEIDADIVEKVSNGAIQFQAASQAKRPGSIRKRVEKIRELLAENRILVSAHCTNLIAMFENLRKGANEVTFVARGQEEKHVFDAFSYMIYMETLEDLEDDIVTAPRVGRRFLSVG